MSIVFKWEWYTMKDGTVTENPQPCDACDADVPVYSFRNVGAQYRRDITDPEPRMFLCALCGSTSAGNAYQYPRQFPNAETMFLINYGNNEILKQLGKFGKRPSSPEFAELQP